MITLISLAVVAGLFIVPRVRRKRGAVPERFLVILPRTTKARSAAIVPAVLSQDPRIEILVGTTLARRHRPPGE